LDGAAVAAARGFRYHPRRRITYPHGEAMKIAALLIAVLGLALTGVASASPGEDLVKKSGCTACHQNDKKLVGPAYQEVATKYKADAGAAAKLAVKVKAGGSGVWGPVPMPPHPQISEADIKTMIAYVLSLKK
jgi:cytochrome c